MEQLPQPQLSDISNAQTELVEFALKKEIQELKHQILKREDEIAHLKELLMSSSPIIGGAAKIILSDMELICLKQIENLKTISSGRDLTLDEVKRLDLLNKNLRLAQSEPTTIDGSPKPLPKDITPEQLIQIASKKG
jgi:hypothetical protein